jgi:MoaA/NifB/PqqE/SkfB family radical SAM enzyme
MENEVEPAARGTNFCILPFVHTAIEANGDVKGCCLTPPFRDASGRPYNLNTHSLDEALGSAAYREFTDSFRHNRRHAACTACWREEDRGSISNRMKFNSKYARHGWNRDLRFLEIKVGNACNLKCRICGPHNSSKSALEAAEVFKDARALTHNHQSQWVENARVWREFADLRLDTIHVMGGEPFLDKNHIPMLEELVTNGRAGDICLWYNSNGTVFPEKLLPLLRQFKQAHISLSLDDVGPRFEYQRFPAKWETVRANLGRFFALDPAFFKIEIDVCWSLFNISYIDEILAFYEEFFAERGMPMNPNIFEGRHFYAGDHFCPKTLRAEQRERIIERLEASPFRQRTPYAPLFRALTAHLAFDAYSPELERERREKIIALDRHRRQNFADFFPELSSVITSPS